jgi:hypothetical protein
MHRVELDGIYEWFLELPTLVVLPLLWVAGVVLEVLCVAELYALYWNGMVLARMMLEGNI